MTVYYSSDFGWKAGQNVTSQLASLVDSTFKAGDTLVLDHKYDLNAGAQIQLPDFFTLAARNGGGFDMQNTSSTDRPMILMGRRWHSEQHHDHRKRCSDQSFRGPQSRARRTL